jgi:bifunctional non-homologous end joining protein LigD
VANKKLTIYRSKRDFTRTVVIQKHAARRLTMICELDGVFKSWAITRRPSLDPHDKRLAVEVEDHPLDYGDFEGTIPKGQYGGGTVQLRDRGTWKPEGNKLPEASLADGESKFTLDGKRLRGSWVLVRMKNDRTGGTRANWLLIKHHDDAARDGGGDAILAEDQSLASGRTMEVIAAGKGKSPKPFMTQGDSSVAADAVWDSSNGLAIKKRKVWKTRIAESANHDRIKKAGTHLS